MTLGVARGLDERNGTKLRERLAPFVAHARNPGKDSLAAPRGPLPAASTAPASAPGPKTGHHGQLTRQDPGDRRRSVRSRIPKPLQ
jgi:hypothetical protein